MNDDRILEPREMEDTRSKTSQRRIRGWLFVCAVARVVISSAVLAIGASTVDLKSFDRGNIPQEAALLLLMALGFWSSLMITSRRGEPVVHSMPRLQATTVLSLLTLLSMVAAGAFGVQAGGCVEKRGH